MQDATTQSVEVAVSELREGKRYYILSASFEVPDVCTVSALARYSEIKSLADDCEAAANVSVPFPKRKSTIPFLSQGTTEGADLEVRRAELQLWLSEFFNVSQQDLRSFFERQITLHGAPAFVHLLNPPAREPRPLYAVHNEDSRPAYKVYNIQEQRWEPVPQLMEGYLGNYRNFFSFYYVDERDYNLTLQYIPWQAKMLAQVKVPIHRYIRQSCNFYIQFASEGTTIWMYIVKTLVSFDLKTFKSIVHSTEEYPPKALSKDLMTRQNQWDNILGLVGKRVHLISPTEHVCYDSISGVWENLPPFPLPDMFLKRYSYSKIFHIGSYLYVIMPGMNVQCRFNLISKLWDEKPMPFTIAIGVMYSAWDSCNRIYVWVANQGYLFKLDQQQWAEDCSIALPQATNLFTTKDFLSGLKRDYDIESNYLATVFQSQKRERRAKSEKEYAFTKHSKEDAAAMQLLRQLDTLPPSEQVAFFKKNKTKALLRKLPMDVVWSLLKEDPSLDSELAPIHRFVPHTYSDGRSLLIPSHCELSAQKFEVPFHSSLSPSCCTSSSPSSPISVGSPSINSNTAISISSSYPSPKFVTLPTSFKKEAPISFQPLSSTQGELERRNNIITILQEQKVQIPEDFICPITQTIMFDPSVTSDGFSYEKIAIQKWLATGNHTSPLTNQTLESTCVFPNYNLRNTIQIFISEHTNG